MRILLSLFILGLSFSAGSTYAYLSPGEVFPELNTAQAPVQAPAALSNSPEENARLHESAISYSNIYLAAAALLIGGIATTVMVKRKPSSYSE